ncbi:hypothetical protein SAMN02745133_02940 [Desulforamulus putei DSM 12395]|uniref:TIGR00299 family protein n=1 Tax=Desulforamulus putei DSM 12395 TaxID=1121429 RepID=A0A1M5CIQ9_9FIRM|nr:nickel pincer cofactor biosynthesis protein LarC [Desulforamulus putei]SHF54665.1 hypothetical protein SAMN02745133_02940 [Desulforamulus putei DSM 12395]
MAIIYFDCFSGISGDMINGALLDAGLPFEVLEQEIVKLNLADCHIKAERVVRRGVSATKFTVETHDHHPHRHLKDIQQIIENSGLEDQVKKTVLEIFTRLAGAEGKIHGVSPEKIHFHEVGAVDAIIDIVGAVAGLHKLGITRVVASPLNVGAGWTKCMHGKIPVPSPATLELLQGVTVYSSGTSLELVTPTGAAIITTICREFGHLPPMIPKAVGYGAGSADPPIPNLLRVIIGKENCYETGKSNCKKHQHNEHKH